MEIERGRAGAIPYAAVGSGSTVLVLPGLLPVTGVESDGLVRGTLSSLRPLAASRRLVVFNRRAGLPSTMTLADMAAEYADALRADFDPPVDLVGNSTGGSIAQQLAADHPDVARRLVLVSSACRLGREGREMQARIAAELRAGRTRTALSLVGAGLAPRGARTVLRALAWWGARRMVPDPASEADLATTLEAEDAFDLATCAQPIRAITLIIAGRRDRFYTPELFTETAALIPNSQLRMFRRRGHITVAGDRRARATAIGFLSYP